MTMNTNYKRLFAAAIALAVHAVSVATAATISFTPIADTWVRLANPTSAFGSINYFESSQNTGSGRSPAWAYVRFDLSSVDFGTVSNVKFDLVKFVSFAGATNVDVYGLVSNEAFGETTLTYNNDPNRSGSAFNSASAYGGVPLATFAATAAIGAVDTAFDVASGSVFDFINADADKIVTFVLQETPISAPGGQRFSSRNHADSAQWPLLTITTVPEPTGFVLLVLGTCSVSIARRRCSA